MGRVPLRLIPCCTQWNVGAVNWIQIAAKVSAKAKAQRKLLHLGGCRSGINTPGVMSSRQSGRHVGGVLLTQLEVNSAHYCAPVSEAMLTVRALWIS